MKKSQFIEIITPINSSDFKLFQSVVNVGIDSHLQGFLKSEFYKSRNPNEHRFIFLFHKSEKHILIRRLQEIADKTTNEDREVEILTWIDDIKAVK